MATSNKKRILLPGIIGFIGLVGFAALLFSRMEPEYGGRTLSEWLVMAEESEEAEQAIRAIGEDAIPFLVKRIKSNQGRLKLRLWGALNKLGIDPWFSSQNTALSEASVGFEILGERGIPTLIDLLESRNRRIRHSTLLCLRSQSSLLSDRINVFVEVLLNDPSPGNRSLAAEILGRIGSNPEIIHALINGLEDPNHHVRMDSALALGRFDIQTASEQRMGVIVDVSYGYFDGKTTASFGDFSPAITNAVPALEKALNDPDKNVRAAAQFALDEIHKVNRH